MLTIASRIQCSLWTDPGSSCPLPCPRALPYTVEPTGNHRGGVLLPEESGFGVQTSQGCPVNRNQGGSRARCWRSLDSVILVGSSPSQRGDWHPISPLGEPLWRPGQVLNYLSSPHGVWDVLQKHMSHLLKQEALPGIFSEHRDLETISLLT